MSLDIKNYFVDELKRVYQEQIASAARAEAEADQAADQVRSEARRREDAKDAVQQGQLAKGHGRRRKRAVAEMEGLLEFVADGLPHLKQGDRVEMGALVDVRIEDEAGEDERTFFFLPVGAGVELHGPGGDGFIVVITPQSPVGRALMHSRRGDSFEIIVDGRDREWTVVDLM